MSSSEYLIIEDQVSDQAGNYKGLAQEALLTCEEDFLALFEALPDVLTWIELGSGHGNGPLLFAEKFPHKKSIGIEFEKARFEVGEKKKTQLALSNVEFIHADLLTCPIPVGDVYFLYFSTGHVLDRILCEIGAITTPFKLVVIESHGDLLNRLNKEYWLKPLSEVSLKSSRYNPQAVIFEKCSQKGTSLHDYSFLSKYLLIQEERNHSWLGESYGLEWLKAEDYQLLTPPRTVKSSSITQVMDLNQIRPDYQIALFIRKLGMVTLQTSQGTKQGILRKIFVTPSFKVEISSGEQVEWSDVQKIFWENILCFDSSSDYFFYPHAL